MDRNNWGALADTECDCLNPRVPYLEVVLPGMCTPTKKVGRYIGPCFSTFSHGYACTCISKHSAASPSPSGGFLVQHCSWSERCPNLTVCSTAVIPWVVPVQSFLSTWPRCLWCFQTTNWKCFLVSWWHHCLPSSSSCSSSTKRQSSGPYFHLADAAVCFLCRCSGTAWWLSFLPANTQVKYRSHLHTHIETTALNTHKRTCLPVIHANVGWPHWAPLLCHCSSSECWPPQHVWPIYSPVHLLLLCSRLPSVPPPANTQTSCVNH